MPKAIPISIFFHERASAGFGLLAASVFRTANRITADDLYEVRLTGTKAHFVWDDGEIRLTPWSDCRKDGFLVVPPMDAFREPGPSESTELDMLHAAADAKISIAAACLGSFLPAAAGLLDGRAATTHWDRIDYAMDRFPAVRWNIREMLIDHGDIVTAGGLLSIVDLCLHVVRKTAGQECAALLGQRLLADTVRQKQSVYATRLIATSRNASTFEALEEEIDKRGADNLGVADMAKLCRMSLRSFHRRFQENYGVTPIKFMQLRRIEKAKVLLAEGRLPIEHIAEQTGFGDVAFFRAVFGRETGMTPGQFRRNMLQGDSLSSR
jgi:transcriptional regulator GlxA family with amidase domain